LNKAKRLDVEAADGCNAVSESVAALFKRSDSARDLRLST
jgi:hypothetical protein